MYRLHNDLMSLTVSPHGAELQSLILHRTAREYLWQGDARYWGRRSPVLFPIVGKLRGGEYRYRGQTYPLGQHGFARDLPFTLTAQTENSLTFTLQDNAHTRAVYPFAFCLTITYTLSDNQLTVGFTVKNPGHEVLWYAVGAHPAFNLPFTDDEAVAACRLTIENSAVLQYGFRNGLLDPAPKAKANTAFTLEQADFAGADTLLYHTPGPTTVNLSNAEGSHGVKICYTNLDYLGIWPPPGQTPFLCLEPWAGITDTYNSSGELEEKFAIQQLTAQAEKHYSYTICIY